MTKKELIAKYEAEVKFETKMFIKWFGENDSTMLSVYETGLAELSQTPWGLARMEVIKESELDKMINIFGEACEEIENKTGYRSETWK